MAVQLASNERDLIISILNDALDSLAADDCDRAMALVQRSVFWLENIGTEDDDIADLSFEDGEGVGINPTQYNWTGTYEQSTDDTLSRSSYRS